MSWTVGRAKRITDACYCLDREPNFLLASLALEMLLVVLISNNVMGMFLVVLDEVEVGQKLGFY